MNRLVSIKFLKIFRKIIPTLARSHFLFPCILKELEIVKYVRCSYEEMECHYHQAAASACHSTIILYSLFKRAISLLLKNVVMLTCRERKKFYFVGFMASQVLTAFAKSVHEFCT